MAYNFFLNSSGYNTYLNSIMGYSTAIANWVENTMAKLGFEDPKASVVVILAGGLTLMIIVTRIEWFIIKTIFKGVVALFKAIFRSGKPKEEKGSKKQKPVETLEPRNVDIMPPGVNSNGVYIVKDNY